MNNKIRLLNRFLIILIILFFPNLNRAEEILIYADSISYDDNQNIIARGNAKIFKNSSFIISDLIIYKRTEEKIILPSEFTFKDEDNNYIEGENGYLKI